MKRVLVCLPVLATLACQVVNTGAGQEFACASQADCATGLICSQSGVCLEPCLDYATAHCAKLMSCTSGFGISYDYGDLPSCIARLQLHCQDFTTEPATTTTLAQVAVCAEDLPNASCLEYWSDTTTACQSPDGTGPNGSPCGLAGQCQSGFCAIPSGQVCGSCTGPPAAGADCSAIPCADGYVCLAAGKSCALPGQDGGPCTAEQDCDFGFQCLGKSDGGFCAPSGPVGTPCDPDKLQGTVGCDGRQGIYCRGASDGGGLCTAFAVAAAGQPCGDVPGSVFTYCEQEGFCAGLDGGSRPSGAAGTCMASAQDGAACDDTNGPNCLEFAVCVSGSCVRDDTQSCGVAAVDGGA
jgi:hypothetical protein